MCVSVSVGYLSLYNLRKVRLYTYQSRNHEESLVCFVLLGICLQLIARKQKSIRNDSTENLGIF